MDFSTEYEITANEIEQLFTATFTASEGAEEGALIGALTRSLLTETRPEDLRVFTAWEDSALRGGILFTRMWFEADTRTVFLLSPVAVATAWQGKGIGQHLISHGLDALRKEGVDIAVTYGDPAFYGRVGFKPVSEAELPAPYKLQHPEGWLGQSLTGAALAPVEGPPRCVAPFKNPDLW